MKNENNIVVGAVLGDVAGVTGMDATINAANSSLLGGGGVDGATHRITGKELLHEYRPLGGCRTGQAKAIRVYNLECRYIIHTVDPVWNGSTCGEQERLASCYKNPLLLTLESGVKWTAFPSTSTDIYRFPVGLAVETTIGTVREFAAEYPGELEQILWTLLDARTKPVYNIVLRKL